MKKLLVGLIVLGLTIQTFAQVKTEKLSEIEILGVNYKYLDAVGASEAAVPVKILEKKAASFDLKNSEFYVDEDTDYYVFFSIPQGKILAVYDGEGEIVRTTERFKDIQLPLSVSNAIVGKYPGWKIYGDIYLVTYNRKGRLNKTYKLFLEKDGKRKRVKTDEKGKFI